MTNLELADALQAEFPGYEVVDVAAAVLRNLHTENTALRVTEDNLRQELRECQDQRRAAFRRIEELDAMRAQIGQGETKGWVLREVYFDEDGNPTMHREPAPQQKPLTDEQLREALRQCPRDTVENLRVRWLYAKDFARAIEAAATEPLLQRIAELEANEKVLLAQVHGHTKWREKIVKASEQAYGENAIRYKFSLTKTGKCMNTFPKEIDGRWFALVPAEDDGHIGHIARIAELEQNNRDLSDDVQRFKKHALNEKAARLELERQLEEARNQSLEAAAVECDKRAHAGDAGALMAARAIRAMQKGQS